MLKSSVISLPLYVANLLILQEGLPVAIYCNEVIITENHSLEANRIDFRLIDSFARLAKEILVPYYFFSSKGSFKGSECFCAMTVGMTALWKNDEEYRPCICGFCGIWWLHGWAREKDRRREACGTVFSEVRTFLSSEEMVKYWRVLSCACTCRLMPTSLFLIPAHSVRNTSRKNARVPDVSATSASTSTAKMQSVIVLVYNIEQIKFHHTKQNKR